MRYDHYSRHWASNGEQNTCTYLFINITGMAHFINLPPFRDDFSYSASGGKKSSQIIMDFLILENETDWLPRNVGKELQQPAA